MDELIRLRAQQRGNDEGIVAYPDSGTDCINYTLSRTAKRPIPCSSKALFARTGKSARSKIVALPSNSGDELLGPDQALHQEVATSLTHVLHFAWSVNFTKGLESFEADCVDGARNLINLCLKAQRPRPASFNFCSSVSATVRTREDVVRGALTISLSYAQGMG